MRRASLSLAFQILGLALGLFAPLAKAGPCEDRAYSQYQQALSQCSGGGGGGRTCRADADCGFGRWCDRGFCRDDDGGNGPWGDGCSDLTQHGYQACVNRSGCSWSTQSNECYAVSGQQCGYYTDHGYQACVNASGCSWSTQSNSCYQVQGQRCEAYTPHGYQACVNASGCSWSTQSNSCYQVQGQRCEYYTSHGYQACVNASGCNWSTVSNSCYRQ